MKLHPFAIIKLASRMLIPIDLATHGTPLTQLAASDSLSDFEVEVTRLCRNNVGYGGYLETRPCYTSSIFAESDSEGARWRNVHLGVDLWSPAGEIIYAPFEAQVHSFQDNNSSRDYGPTIILAHNMGETAPRFYTLYGHLSKLSLVNLQVGDPVQAGTAFAKTGHAQENGGWPPHLHFQVITDMLGKSGDYPGVCYPDEIAAWSQRCPNPAGYTGLDLT